MSGSDQRNPATPWNLERRQFIGAVGGASLAAVGSAVLGVPALAEDKPAAPPRPETNLKQFMATPKKPHSLPGPFPGKVVQVTDPKVIVENNPRPEVVKAMFEKGLTTLTGKDLKGSFDLFFKKDDVVGIKVNPVGGIRFGTRHEVVAAVIGWLTANGLPKQNIVIWDRFGDMLKEGGYTKERYPGVQIEALQTLDESFKTFRDAQGHHICEANFDKDWFYFAKGVFGKGVANYKDDEAYFNQHVHVGEESYFGKVLTQKLTKIINIPVFKNTGNGVSMATKNLGYGAISNTGRLHQPLFFSVCTEVLAAPPVRDKLVLNINDGLWGQYDGGPMPNEQFLYQYNTLYFATDPFAMDMIGHRHLYEKRKAMNVKVSDNPRFTQYLYDAEKLGLGVADPAKIQLVTA